MMCWGREDMIEHQKCMRWMIDHCEDHSTGHGACHELDDYVKKACSKPGAEQAECMEYSKELGVKLSKGLWPTRSTTTPEPTTTTTTTTHKPLPPQPQVIMDKSIPETGLPDQGFNGHSDELVSHEDASTATADWGAEWPQSKLSEDQMTERICKKYPRLAWCQLWLKDQEIRAAQG